MATLSVAFQNADEIALYFNQEIEILVYDKLDSTSNLVMKKADHTCSCIISYPYFLSVQVENNNEYTSTPKS